MIYIRLLVAVVLTFFATFAVAVNLEDIEFSELPGGRFEMRAEFSGPPQSPQGYAIESPARIIFDLPDVENLLTQKRFPLAFGNAQSAVVLGANNKTRVIINLSSPSTYSTSVEGNTLVAIVDNTGGGSTSYTRQQEPPSQTFTDSTGNSIIAVDFKRSEDGAGELLLSLSNPSISVDVEERVNTISLNFVDTVVPDELRRRLDVIDFATPVQFIETITSGNNTQINIEATGDYEFLAYQTDENYVVSVKELSAQELAEKNARKATAKSLYFSR